MPSIKPRPTSLVLGLCLANWLPAGLHGQDAGRPPPPDSVRFHVDGLTVTATRNERPIFLTPSPSATVDGDALGRLLPVTATDGLRTVPGVDVSGVGGRQNPPVIRGLRGQRILLLADGLRLNNARRQQDFGEVPALVRTSDVSRVEVVKGPASVLYGSDAIGGVVNLITGVPESDTFDGRIGVRFGSAQDDWTTNGGVSGRSGAWDFHASGDWRKGGTYVAPRGRFGDIDLQEPVRVRGTGSEEWGLRGGVGLAVSPGHRVSVQAALSDAGESGFGFVDPAAYAPDQPTIDITYPSQTFTRLSAGYEADLGSLLADRVDLRLYRQDNERELRFSLTQSFGPQAPPGAGLEVVTENYTDIETVGFRVESKKLMPRSVLLTYGLDGFRDASANTDVTMSTVTGFGPPQTDSDDAPRIPNASYSSFGAFAQGEVALGDLTVIVGGRGQRVSAETRSTPGIPLDASSRSEWSIVGAANLLYRLTDRIVAIGSIGRGFRAPNLVELFFEGPVVEAGAYQQRSVNLEAERSLSVDLGLRYRGQRVALEAFLFNNDLDGGIRAASTGETVDGLPSFRNVNVEQLRYQGAEAAAQLFLGAGWSAGGSFSWIASEDRVEPDNPVGDTFDRRTTAYLEYQDPSGRFWSRADIRRNGERKDVELGTNPLGSVLPAFTVVDVSAGVTLDRWSGFEQRLVVRVENLADELYAEFPNAAFFRPAPGRRLAVGLELGY